MNAPLVSGPDALERLDAGSNTMDPVDVLYRAAREQIPISTTRGVTVGIPAATLGERRAEGLYYNDRVVERYRFELDDGWWQMRELLHRAPFEPLGRAAGAPGALGNAGYSSVVATLYDESGSVRDSDWQVSTIAQTGTYFRDEQYQTNLPFSAAFHEGSEAVGDTTFEVSFTGPWESWRHTTHTGHNSTYIKDPDLYFTYDSAGFSVQAGAEEAKVTFYLRVTRPVTNVQISGPTFRLHLLPAGYGHVERQGRAELGVPGDGRHR